LDDWHAGHGSEHLTELTASAAIFFDESLFSTGPWFAMGKRVTSVKSPQDSASYYIQTIYDFGTSPFPGAISL